MTIANITKSEGESIQNYLIHLKSTAKDCEYTCPNCNSNLQHLHIKDQFIRGLHNKTMTAHILAKARYLPNLTDIIKHAEAFETALHDQFYLKKPCDHAARVSDYKKSKQAQNHQSKPCSGSGSTTHNTSQQSSNCPAWGRQCLNCNKFNHFAKVCKQLQKDTASALIAQVKYDNHVGQYTAATTDITTKIPATVSIHTPGSNNNTTTLQIFPDSGASICLGGPNLLKKLHVNNDNLIRCNKNITAVGGTKLKCKGWVPLKFVTGCHKTIQPVHICNKVDKLYFSKKGC